jgi:sarcosine oxidase subunit beta
VPSVPDIVVIGAGVMGASVAWHLASSGCRAVTLIDAGASPGEGSTGRATGGFRAQYATAINIRLSLLAREKLRRFAEDVGGDCGYHPAGYLWLASTPAELLALDEARALQHAEGLREAHAVTPAEITQLNPAVMLDGIVGGAFCPTDGFIRPLGILDGYLAAAVRLGARVRWRTRARGLQRDARGRVTGVRTDREVMACGAVVNAAGAWAGAVARDCGFEIPVTPLRRQVAVTVPTTALPPDMPMTIFVSDGFHLRVRDGRVLLLWPTPGVAGAPFDTRVDATWIDDVTAKAHARVPGLRAVPIDRSGAWAGLYEMSPDKHALLGLAPGEENLYLINGSSGHGVMHAPALGHLLAEMILDGAARTLDVSALDPGRFAARRPNPVSELL